MAPSDPFAQLASETRQQILAYILPDISPLPNRTGTTTYTDPEPGSQQRSCRYYTPSRRDNQSSFPNIMRVNKQLCEDSYKIVYGMSVVRATIGMSTGNDELGVTMIHMLSQCYFGRSNDKMLPSLTADMAKVTQLNLTIELTAPYITVDGANMIQNIRLVPLVCAMATALAKTRGLEVLHILVRVDDAPDHILHDYHYQYIHWLLTPFDMVRDVKQVLELATVDNTCTMPHQLDQLRLQTHRMQQRLPIVVPALINEFLLYKDLFCDLFLVEIHEWEEIDWPEEWCLLGRAFDACIDADGPALDTVIMETRGQHDATYLAGIEKLDSLSRLVQMAR